MVEAVQSSKGQSEKVFLKLSQWLRLQNDFSTEVIKKKLNYTGIKIVEYKATCVVSKQLKGKGYEQYSCTYEKSPEQSGNYIVVKGSSYWTNRASLYYKKYVKIYGHICYVYV